MSLTELYLADNTITKLEGIAALTALKRLHLRGNRIATLDGFTHDMPALEYLNLRENPIDALAELQFLAVLTKLHHLVLAGTPISAMAEYRLEPLVLVRSLARLDKSAFEEDEKNEAAEVWRWWVYLCVTPADPRAARGSEAPGGRAQAHARGAMSTSHVVGLTAAGRGDGRGGRGAVTRSRHVHYAPCYAASKNLRNACFFSKASIRPSVAPAGN